MEEKKALNGLKTIATIVVSAGATVIVGNAVRFTTPETIGAIKKACVGFGTLVLGSMLADKASEYTEQKIDQAEAEVKKMFTSEEPVEEKTTPEEEQKETEEE